MTSKREGRQTAAGDTGTREIIHATCVAMLSGSGKASAAILLGRSGSGKSSLALELMATGARLVADDRTVLFRKCAVLTASAPPSLRGLIEARSVGLLRADFVPQAEVVLAVDLDRHETRRLPPERAVTFLGVAVPLLHKVESRHFPAAIRQYLLSGRANA